MTEERLQEIEARLASIESEPYENEGDGIMTAASIEVARDLVAEVRRLRSIGKRRMTRERGVALLMKRFPGLSLRSAGILYRNAPLSMWEEPLPADCIQEWFGQMVDAEAITLVNLGPAHLREIRAAFSDQVQGCS